MATDKLKLAFVGCGAIARFHLDGIVERELPIEITAAVDTNLDRAESFARETGAEPFADFGQAIEQGEFYIREVKDEVMFQCCFGLDFR